MTYDLEHLGRQVDKLSDAIEENTNEKRENNMNDIAGLLALMQGNKGMDLPGLLALCKEKGYARAAMECRILQSQKDCCCEMNQRFDRLECTINTNRLADENARLTRENEALKDTIRGDRIADAAVQRLENFAIQHYKVTNVPSGASA